MPPSFLNQLDSETTVSVKEGGDTSLDCSSFGYPLPNTTWEFNQEPLQLSPRVEIESSGVLRISHVKGEDNGRYLCTVHSIAGEKTRSFKLVVTGKMSFRTLYY